MVGNGIYSSNSNTRIHYKSPVIYQSFLFLGWDGCSVCCLLRCILGKGWLQILPRMSHSHQDNTLDLVTLGIMRPLQKGNMLIYLHGIFPVVLRLESFTLVHSFASENGGNDPMRLQVFTYPPPSGDLWVHQQLARQFKLVTRKMRFLLFEGPPQKKRYRLDSKSGWFKPPTKWASTIVTTPDKMVESKWITGVK